MALLLGGLTIGPLSAARLPTAGDLQALGWSEHRLPGTAPNQFRARPDGVVEIVADDSASFLYKDVSGMSAGNPVLRWRWRVDQSSGITRLAQRGGDDRPAAIHVWFPLEQDERGFWSLVTDALGIPATGRALTYVWGGTEPPGTLLPNPYMEGDGAMIVLRSGTAPQGRWFTERVDLEADFRRAFGFSPPAARYLTISADFDDTMGRSRAAIADIVFGPAVPVGATPSPGTDTGSAPGSTPESTADGETRR